MSKPQAAARVWVRSEGSVKRGTVSIVEDESGYVTGDNASVTIVLEGGTCVAAVPLSARGTIWELRRRDSGGRNDVDPYILVAYNDTYFKHCGV